LARRAIVVTVASNIRKSITRKGVAIMVRPSPDPTTSIYDCMAYFLRFMRMNHNATQAEVGKVIGCSNTQVSKYESGDKQLDAKQCLALDKEWDTGGFFSIMLVFAKQGVDGNLPRRRRRYQLKAIEHHIFSENMIPLPFQTEDYARGLLQAGHAAGDIDDVDAALAERMEIQNAILEGRPDIWVVIDQTALRPMGPPEVMAAQRERLLELGALNHISLRVLPMSAEPHIGVNGSFWCVTLPDRRRAAISYSGLGMGHMVDDQEEAARVAVRFQRLAARAWNEDQSRRYLAEASEDHGDLA
jgi:transcriptional regulator with XRE-family HTH domain